MLMESCCVVLLLNNIEAGLEPDFGGSRAALGERFRGERGRARSGRGFGRGFTGEPNMSMLPAIVNPVFTSGGTRPKAYFRDDSESTARCCVTRQPMRKRPAAFANAKKRIPRSFPARGGSAGIFPAGKVSIIRVSPANPGGKGGTMTITTGAYRA